MSTPNTTLERLSSLFCRLYEAGFRVQRISISPDDFRLLFDAVHGEAKHYYVGGCVTITEHTGPDNGDYTLTLTHTTPSVDIEGFPHV